MNYSKNTTEPLEVGDFISNGKSLQKIICLDHWSMFQVLDLETGLTGTMRVDESMRATPEDIV